MIKRQYQPEDEEATLLAIDEDIYGPLDDDCLTISDLRETAKELIYSKYYIKNNRQLEVYYIKAAGDQLYYDDWETFELLILNEFWFQLLGNAERIKLLA